MLSSTNTILMVDVVSQVLKIRIRTKFTLPVTQMEDNFQKLNTVKVRGLEFARVPEKISVQNECRR